MNQKPMFDADDDDLPTTQTCVVCHTQSPPSRSSYTLISTQHGWRLVRGAGGAPEWRCPKCWEQYKQARRVEASTPSEGVPRIDERLRSSPLNVSALRESTSRIELARRPVSDPKKK